MKIISNWHSQGCVIGAFLALMACTTGSHGQNPLESGRNVDSKMSGDSGESTVGNPASRMCADKGGKIEIYTNEDGQTGFCNLEGGLIEEWTLFSFISNPGIQVAAITAFLTRPQSSPMTGWGNPASIYCERVGGKSSAYTTAYGAAGVCAFSDRSQMEEWTLYRGPDDSKNRKLAAVLKSVH